MYNLNLHNFILEQFSVKFSFPYGLNDSTKNSIILFVTIDCALSCTKFNLLTINS